jgi:hypothetical protein
MQNSNGAARQSYAEELRFTASVRSRAVVAAFAAVPRERFVGSGPWWVKSPMNLAEYWTTDDADPRAVYHDVLIALDEERGINNGQPSLWAFLFDRLGIAAGEHVLHLGCRPVCPPCRLHRFPGRPPSTNRPTPCRGLEARLGRRRQFATPRQPCEGRDLLAARRGLVPFPARPDFSRIGCIMISA